MAELETGTVAEVMIAARDQTLTEDLIPHLQGRHGHLIISDVLM